MDEFKYKVFLLKNYFDAGLGLTSYFKYFIAGYALSSANVKTTILITFFYGIFCFLLGFLMFKYGWIDAQAEVANRYNPFVKEMRKKINGKRFK